MRLLFVAKIAQLHGGLEQPIANWAKRVMLLPGVVGKWFSRLLHSQGPESHLPYIGEPYPQDLGTSKLATTRILVSKLATARVLCFPTHHPQVTHCALINKI